MTNLDVYNSRDIGLTIDKRHQIRTLGAVCMFLMWAKMGYWMNLFDGPAMFITQIYEVVASIKGFSIIYLVVLAAFANFFAII